MGGGEQPEEVGLVGTWFMFVAQFNQLVWVTFRVVLFLFFRTEIDVEKRLLWKCCFCVCDFVVPLVFAFPFLLFTFPCD